MNRKLNKILLVEDNKVTAQIEKKKLEKQGYSIKIVHSGHKALERIMSSEEIDLILMDLHLGEGLNGTETASLINQKKDIPIIFLSSHKDSEIIDLTKDVFSYGFVHKSSGIHVLDTSIKTALKLYESNQKIKNQAEKLKTVNQKLKNTLNELTQSRELEKQEKEKFINLFDNMKDGVAVYKAIDNGKDFIFKDINKAGQKVDSVKKEDIIDKRVTQIFPGIRDFGLLEVMKNVWKSEKPQSLPLTQYKDNRISCWRSNFVYKLKTGEIVVIYSDMTHKKKIENQLSNNRARYKTLIEGLPDIIMRFDKKFRHLFVSKNVSQVVEMEAEDFIGKTHRELGFSKEKSQLWENAIRKVFDTGKINETQLKIKSPSKTTIFNWRLIPEFDNNGKVKTVLTISRDITEKKKAEKALKESDKQKKLILNSTSELVLYCDIDQNIIWANQAAGKSVNKKTDDLIGKHCYKIWENREKPCPDCPVLKALKTRKPQKAEKQTTDGRSWFVRGFPVFDENHKIIGLVEFTKDITEEKKIENQIKQILNSTEQSFVLLNKDYKIKTFNYRAELYSQELFNKKIHIGQSIFEFVEAENKDNFRKYFKRTLNGETISTELKINNFWFSFTFSPTYDNENKINGICFNTINITERKKAEKRLQESEAKNKAILDAIPDLFLIQNTEGTYLDYYTQDKSKLYIEPKKFIGKKIENIFSPKLAEKFMRILKKVIKTRKTGFIEYNIPIKNEIHYFEARIVPYGPQRVLTIIRDISEKKKTEKEREHFMSAITQAAESIEITDHHGIIQFVNPAFEKITGYTAEEVIGKNPKILSSGKQDEKFYKELWATISNGDTWEGRFINKKKNGKLYTEEAVISPVFNENNEIVNYVAVKRDISDKIELEEKYRQSQKMESIGRLAGGIAHDLNNLLTPILGYSEMMQDELEPNDPNLESINEIVASSERARDLIQQLLTFSRKQPFKKQPVILNQIINDIKKLISKTIKENIQIVVKNEKQMKNILADKRQIEQIIMNLSINAADAMPNGGTLEIETDMAVVDKSKAETFENLIPGRYAVLHVTDSGTGMTEETLKHIFEPFFSTKGVKGTGLGLATVFGIIKQHHGDIKVKSTIGMGTTFTIYLPLSDTAARITNKTEKTYLHNKGKETVLIVEDNEHVARLTEHVLKNHGYKTFTSLKISEALEILKSIEIELLISDVIMPTMNGKEFYDIAKEILPELKVIFMSGYPDEVLDSILEQKYNYIQKPFSVKTLTRAVREAFDVEEQNNKN